MVDGGNESLGVAVLNLTGTRTAARPATPPPSSAREHAAPACILCICTPTNNHAGDMTLHYITTTLILIGII